ncbi:hypothetical protein [Pedobacter ginsengisoli]|uniref:hypothetical protein n=1 Tax=Pedobacter ginsengisoli TaxID=363852 RepID=UPI00254A7128|nr:hypothetical protein [Pedobacter ginsengisoli]
MKTWICICVMLVGCDQLNTTESDLKKYPEIQPFILGHKEFEASHDIDLGLLKFSYKLNKFYSSPIITLDSIAVHHKWTISLLSENERIYSKRIKSYPVDNEADSLYLKFDSDENRLFFENY